MAKKMNEADAASAAGNTQGRMTVGPGGPGYGVASVKTGKSVPKGNTQAGGDPSMGTKTNRSAVPQPPAERQGGAYRIVVSNGYATPNQPEAALTQANGRVLKSSLDRGRSRSTFDDGPTIAY